MSAASTGPTATRGPRAGTGDPSAVYVRSLIRSQLRVAVISAVAFAALLAAATAVLAFVPEARAFAIAGVPVVWLVLGVGVYPLVLGVAWLFTRAAERNEARYRSLAEDDE